MKNNTFKSLVIFCSAVLLSALLFSMVSCTKKKPPEPVVQKPSVSAEDEARKRTEEEARLKAEDEARAKAKRRADEEARLKAEEEVRLKAEAKAAEEAAKAEEETRAKAKEEAKAAEALERASHEVVKGESLWKIAKHKDVYENPFMWPIIYKANHDKINDPDLIYPKQVFSIPRDFSSANKDKAVHHARTRGEWSLHDGSEKYWESGYIKTK